MFSYIGCYRDVQCYPCASQFFACAAYCCARISHVTGRWLPCSLAAFETLINLYAGAVIAVIPLLVVRTVASTTVAV